jgi:hypothetical protein
MPADLHVHTNFSDGTESPASVVTLAKEKGLTAIAITDHDVIAGIEPARLKGQEVGMEIVPGVEFTTENAETEIHVLGYFIDLNNAELLAELTHLQKGREERIFKICDRLQMIKLPLDPERVFAIAGHRSAGRPHVAKALIEAGYVRTIREAFDRYIGFKGPAYVEHYRLSPVNAVRLIDKTGGLAVFGHPAVSDYDKIIPELIAAGLAGIEAYYSGHDLGQTNHYLQLAKKYNLLVTAGSDFHGLRMDRKNTLGEPSLSDELFQKLKDEHLRRNQS